MELKIHLKSNPIMMFVITNYSMSPAAMTAGGHKFLHPTGRP